MAIALVQHTAGSFGATGTVSSGTFTQNVTQGNLLLAAITSFTTSVTNLVDNNGNSYTQIGTIANSLNDIAGLWYCGSANAGSTIVTGTFSAVHARSLALYEYSGALKTGVLNVAGSAAGTSTSVLAGTLTPSQNNSLVFYVGCDDTGTHNGVTSATGYTQRDIVDNSASFESLYTQDLIQATAGTTAGSFTITPSAGWAAVGAVFKPVITAGTLGTAVGNFSFSGNLSFTSTGI